MPEGLCQALTNAVHPDKEQGIFSRSLKTGDSLSCLNTYISSTCKAMLDFVGFRRIIYGADGYTLVTAIINFPCALQDECTFFMKNKGPCRYPEGAFYKWNFSFY
jgi:hypothetical protein